MKQLKLFVLISLISFSTLAQNKNDITGNWKVVQLLLPEAVKNNKKANIQMIEKMFLQSIYHFNNDGTCVVECPVKEMQFKNCSWTFAEKDRSISIDGTAPDGNKGMLMKFFVSSKNGKWYFEVDESPITLEVQKMTGANK
jgi:hypothetical protein